MNALKSKPILYIKPGCPWCNEALAFFSQHGLELDVRDVNTSEADRQQMQKVSGQTRTPTFVYGDFMVADFSVNEFLEKLAQAPEIKKELGLGGVKD